MSGTVVNFPRDESDGPVSESRGGWLPRFAAATATIATIARRKATGKSYFESYVPLATSSVAGALAAADYTLLHQIATDTGWQAVAGGVGFATNWANFTTTALAQYKRDALGWVCLTGLVKKSVALAYTDTIFTLPVGYRPTSDKRFPITGSVGTFGQLVVTTAGLVALEAGGSATYTSLEGIRFDPAT